MMRQRSRWTLSTPIPVSYTHLDVYKRQVHNVGYVHVHNIARPRRKLHILYGLRAEMGAPPDVPLKRLEYLDGFTWAFLKSEHRRKGPRILQRVELVYSHCLVIHLIQPPPMRGWRIAEKNSEDQLAAHRNFCPQGQKPGDPTIPPIIDWRLSLIHI